jgi:hypothetical protein
MKHRILFDLKKEYYLNSFISIVRAMDADGRFEYAFYVGPNDERRWGIFPVYHKERIEAQLRAQGHHVVGDPAGFDAIVSADGLRDAARYGAVPVFVSDHGPGTKTLRFRNVVGKSRRYTVFVEGRYWMDVIKRYGCESGAEWLLTGVPKLDPFFWPGYYDKATILAKLGLSPERKTVVFAPSYRPSCIPFIGDRIKALADEYNVIVKLHPYSWGGKYAPVNQARPYVRLARRDRRIRLIDKSEHDIHPYMAVADTIISDTSSTLAICLALGKVGIVADFPYPRMKHSDGMPVVSDEPHDYLRGVFVHMADVSQLRKCVAEAATPTQEHMQRLMEYRNYYFTGLDGRAGERAAAAISEALSRK